MVYYFLERLEVVGLFSLYLVLQRNQLELLEVLHVYRYNFFDFDYNCMYLMYCCSNSAKFNFALYPFFVL